MKRGILIGVGTLGSLGAVLAITPPQFGSTHSTASALGGTTTPSTPSTPAPVASTSAPTKSATAPAPTKSATTKPSTKPTPQATKSTPTPQATHTQTPTPTPTPTQTQAQSAGVSGTFTGSTFPASEYGRNWGNVHVTVTLKDGKITSINGAQSPASRGYMAFNQIDPYVAAQKISIATIKSTAASALPFVSGASYSSMAYWQSLKTALQQAGI